MAVMTMKNPDKPALHGPQRNYEYLKSLPPRLFAEAILTITENCCLACPRERERRCNENCGAGLTEWLWMPYREDSKVWHKRRKQE